MHRRKDREGGGIGQSGRDMKEEDETRRRKKKALDLFLVFLDNQ